MRYSKTGSCDVTACRPDFPAGESEKETGKEAEKLPSTSPANAIFTLDRLTESWGAEIFGRTEENESVKGTV